MKFIEEKKKERNAANKWKNSMKQFCVKMSHVYIPSAALTFVAIYWAVGLKNARFY